MASLSDYTGPILATIGAAASGAVVALIKAHYRYKESAAKKAEDRSEALQDDLFAEVKALKDEIRALRVEVDLWQEKYNKLYAECALKDADLRILNEKIAILMDRTKR